MSFVLLEDQKPPLPKRQLAVFGSVRIVRPFYRIARFTYRSTRFLVKQCITVWRSVKLRPQPAGGREEVKKDLGW